MANYNCPSCGTVHADADRCGSFEVVCPNNNCPVEVFNIQALD